MKKLFIITGILGSLCMAQENFILRTQASNAWSSIQARWPLSTPLTLVGCGILAVYAGYKAIVQYRANAQKHVVVPIVQTIRELCIKKIASLKSETTLHNNAKSKQITTPIYSSPIPHEIFNKISALHATTASLTQENTFEKNSGESISSSFMLLPYTIRKISFIRPHPLKYWSGPQPDVFISWKREYTQKNAVLPEIDMRMMTYNSYKSFNELHLNIDTEGITCYCGATHIQFLIKDLGKAFVKYDGFNIHNIAVITTTTQSEHLIYLLEKYKYKDKDPDVNKRYSYKPKELPLLQQNIGYLRSCMLYPDENKVLCAIANNAEEHSNRYKLSLYEINESQEFNIIAASTVNHLFKKTIYLGPFYKNKESYLGLTEEGRLALIWLHEPQKKFEYFLITHFDRLANGRQVERKFADIATDESVQQDKIRCRIACLNMDNEVFLCDIRAFHKQTLLCATEKPLQAHGDIPWRLLYDNHKYAVIWKDQNSANLTRVTVSSDNFEQLYLKTLFKYTKTV